MSSSVAEVLNLAADLIEEHGHWKGRAFERGIPHWRFEDGGMCISGAVYLAAYRLAGLPERRFPEVGNTSSAALHAEIGGPIDKWNDAPERTQEEAVEMLRRAAERAS